MEKDELMPKSFGNMSRFDTPWVSIAATSGIMIAVILLLDLEDFVKTASTLQLVLFTIANLAVIFMREGNLRHYRPKYRAPGYPWVQAIAISAYGFLIFQMGFWPMVTAALFLFLGYLWFLFFAYGRIKREYALLHVVERILGRKRTSHMVDEELREVLIERDDITEKRFHEKIENAVVLDSPFFLPPIELANEIAPPLAKRLNISEENLRRRIIKRERDSNIIVTHGYAIISLKIPGKNRFEMAMVRAKKGTFFSKDYPPAHAAFVVVASPDQEHFYLHSLMWLVGLAELIDFDKEWIEAPTTEDLRHLILKAWMKSCLEGEE